MKSYIAKLFLLVFPTVIFSQNISDPSSFLGYELGMQFSRHHQVEDYFQHVYQMASDRVKLEKYGETYERRPLYLAYISSKENLQNLESLRKYHLKNAGLYEGSGEKPKIAIVWLSYNVHGNEASSSEAAMNTVYKLLTEKEEWLKNTIVIIDPCLNPDGRDRYVNWYNGNASSPYNVDQQALEHVEPWPLGRPNHYLFDLNRDWAWATQIETQARLKAYNKWMPHIHVDFHEQHINEPYYFAPAAEPYHELISDWQRNFQVEIGKNNAKYFDEKGWLYFTKEIFDLLYPSYGDTYPTLMGAIGMTYEQAGHSKSGLGVLNDEGEILTLKKRIEHHTTSGLATIEMASKHAERINDEFHKFFSDTNLNYKSFVLQGETDKISALTHLLDQHNIEYQSAQSGKANGFKYSTNKSGSLTTTSKDLVIHTNQPKGKLVQALFEPNTKLTDSLTYDITAWSLPYAYGLEAIASAKQIPSDNFKDSSEETQQSNEASLGYILKWNSMKDASFLAALLKHNIKIRFTERPLKTANQTFDRGSLIIVKSENSNVNNLDSLLVAEAQTFNRTLHGITSGFSDSGPDLGSSHVKLVNKQKIAVLSGNHINALNFGSIWHFFEQQLHYPITVLHEDSFKNVDLNRYSTLILPDGDYKSVLTEKTMEKLQSWIKNGGKVIAIGKAIKAFANQKGFQLKTNKTAEDLKKEIDSVNLVPYANRERDNLKKNISGAIFKAEVDSTHPMAFGYSSTYYTLKSGYASYKLLGGKNYNIAYLQEPKTISGFAGSNALKQLENSLLFGEERLGKGSLIYMVDDTTFRSFWENGKLFLVNAVFFVNNGVYADE